MGDDRPRSADCDHRDQTAVWRGFDAAAKNLGRPHGPCDLWSDSRCPVGHSAKLMAYRARRADLIGLHGYDGLTQDNNNAHGLDLVRITPEGAVTHVWEFSRDDPAAIRQAVANLEHIRTSLGAEPGPAFEHPQMTGHYAGGGPVTRVRSHPELPGIELFDVIDCPSCERAGRWVYAGLDLRVQRIDDHTWADGGAPRFGRRAEPTSGADQSVAHRTARRRAPVLVHRGPRTARPAGGRRADERSGRR